MWGMGAQTVQYANYCPACEVFGAKGEPCWSCGSPALLAKPAPCSGFHYDPDSDMATVGSTAGPIALED